MNNDCYGSALHIFTINQSIILFSDAGYKSGSHDADVDLQLTNKMWNNKQNNL